MPYVKVSPPPIYALILTPIPHTPFLILTLSYRGVPEYSALQSGMLLDLLEWSIETSDITPLAEDPRDAPKFPGKPPFPWPPTSANAPPSKHPHLRH